MSINNKKISIAFCALFICIFVSVAPAFAQYSGGIGERKIIDNRVKENKNTRKKLFVAPRRLSKSEKKIRDESYKGKTDKKTPRKVSRKDVPDLSDTGLKEPSEELKKLQREAQAERNVRDTPPEEMPDIKKIEKSIKEQSKREDKYYRPYR